MNLVEDLKESSQNLVILYVEDEADTRNQITQILGIFFKKVIVGVNGLDALEKYNDNLEKIDLVMTDLTMPKMDGLSMLKEIKKINNQQNSIILTAHNSSEKLMKIIDLEIDGCLLKPVNMDEMIKLLLSVTKTISIKKNS